MDTTKTALTASATNAAPAPVDDRGGDFGWHDNPTIVLREQPATAVYCNTYGQVVIRQQSIDGGDDDDPAVIIEPHHVARIVAAIRKAVGR